MKRTRHKFSAKRTEYAGRKYDSKAEARYALQLTMDQRGGTLLFWLEQVPIRLPGGTKYVVDFMEFWANGDIRFVDVKGVETEAFKIKKREVEALYPFEIEVVKC